MAKKSQEPIVIASKAKGVLKRAGCNTSGDAFMALNGYLYYTDGINEGLRADTQVWGGAAIGFRY